MNEKRGCSFHAGLQCKSGCILEYDGALTYRSSGGVLRVKTPCRDMVRTTVPASAPHANRNIIAVCAFVLRRRFSGPDPGSVWARVFRISSYVDVVIAAQTVVSSLSARLSLSDDHTERLIPEGAVDPKYIEESMDTPDTGSFMHLHLGVDGKGLDDLDIHYSVRHDKGRWLG